ncbi:MAG: ribosome maturation factor RimM [Bacilli bacterium]|nr:ribosome maturation factor RimM [Bacilli bacterium]
MEFLRLGKIIDAFSLDGTLKILSSSYFSEDRYLEGNKIYLVSPNGNKEEVTVVDFRKNKDLDFVKVNEITSKEEALERKGYFVEIEKDDSFLNKDEYYFVDLEKCDVYDEDNNLLGKVKKVEEFPAQITLRVTKKDGKDFFVPFINQFIKTVDIKNHKIIIKVMEGML